MDGLNEIETIKFDNCTVHFCDDSIAKTKEEQDKIWQEFSNIAHKLLTKEGGTNEKKTR